MSAAGPSDWWTWLAVLGVSSTTLVTRASFLVLGARARLPPLVERALRYAPAAALAALVVPDLLVHGTAIDVAPTNPRLLGALAAIAAFLATRSMTWTSVVGMAAFTAGRLLV